MKRLVESGFVRSVSILAGGTALAQGITVLALPFLTRLYTPEDFSVLAVYVALLTMVSVVACLRLEVAIPLPENDDDAINLLALALLLALLVAALIGLIVLLFSDRILALLRQPGLRPFLWLIPLGIWLAASYSALQYWATRKKRFKSIAQTRVLQAGTAVSTQLGLGWLGIAPFGLLLGHMFLAGMGSVGLGRTILRKEGAVLSKLQWSSMREMFWRYRRFPQYSTLEELANNAALQLPVVIIAAYALGGEAGFLFLAIRAFSIPLTLISASISNVYYSRAADEDRKGMLSEFTLKVVSGMAKTGGGPLLLLGIVAPPLSALVFGEEWRRAGELMSWLTLSVVFRLLSSPVSMVMHVKMMQQGLLFLTLSGLVLRVGAMLCIFFIYNDYLAETYAITGFMFYLACYFIFLHVSGNSLIKSLKLLFESAHIWLIFVAIGLLLRYFEGVV